MVGTSMHVTVLGSVTFISFFYSSIHLLFNYFTWAWWLWDDYSQFSAIPPCWLSIISYPMYAHRIFVKQPWYFNMLHSTSKHLDWFLDILHNKTWSPTHCPGESCMTQCVHILRSFLIIKSARQLLDKLYVLYQILWYR